MMNGSQFQLSQKGKYLNHQAKTTMRKDGSQRRTMKRKWLRWALHLSRT